MDPANITLEQMNTLLADQGWDGDPVTVCVTDDIRNASGEWVYKIAYGSNINRVYVGENDDGVYVDNATMR